MRREKRIALLCAALSAAIAVVAQAQRFGGEGYAYPLRSGMPDAGVQGGFTFCRLWFDSPRRLPSGLGWSTDYPRADQNFVHRLTQLTAVRATAWRDGTPGHATFRADDPGLFTCPFLFISDAGSMELNEREIATLREYLLKGGFLWVDDFWAEPAWSYWAATLRRVLPEYETVELTTDHRIFNTFYVVTEVPQIPSMQHWTRSGGGTAEFGPENRPSMHAVFDDDGRMLVLMTYNTDIADGWERETDSELFFQLFSPKAYAIAMNVAIWVLTH